MLDPELAALYQEVILDHGRSPRNFRKIEPALQAHGYNPLCGDDIRVFVKLSEDAQQITDVSFTGRGCAISQASASLMTELLINKPVLYANALFQHLHAMCSSSLPAAVDASARQKYQYMAEDLERLAVLSGVKQFPSRVKCATLAWHAMQAAMQRTGKVSTE